MLQIYQGMLAHTTNWDWVPPKIRLKRSACECL